MAVVLVAVAAVAARFWLTAARESTDDAGEAHDADPRALAPCWAADRRQSGVGVAPCQSLVRGTKNVAKARGVADEASRAA